MIKLLKYFRWYHWLFVLVIIGLIYIQVDSDLRLPDYLGKILELSITQDEANRAEIRKNGLRMLGFASISMACTVIVGFLAARLAGTFSHDLRNVIYRKVQKFSMEEINDFSTASLITRSTNDVNQVQMVVIMTLRMAVSAPIMAIKAITKIANKSSDLSFVVFIAVSFLVVFVFTLFAVITPKFKLIQKNTDRLNLVARENLTGLRVVRANNAQDIEKEKFAEINDKITQNNKFVNRVMSLMYPGMMLVMNGVSLGIVWLGAYVVNEGKLFLPDVFAFQQSSMMIVFSFMSLTMISIMLPRGIVSGNRINEVLEKKTKVIDPIKEVIPSEDIKGTIEFQNVYFTYPDASEHVLEDISFKVNKGQTVAFIGSTGSGKSTLINLVPRFFDVTKGKILVDGVDVKNYKQNKLRDKIGYVPQKGVLFTGTIESNLRFGLSKANQEDFDYALEISQAKEFVSKLDLGLQNPISQGGTNVSGGQKQRLSIARAVIKKPEIYIFDDSFSALDFKTDKLLREALKEKTKDATKLIVAQRIGTILEADKIIVLEQGKIVGMGTHKELLNSCEVYQEIAYSQLSKEELANE